MAISLDEVRHVATLARLELDEAEVARFQGELNAILGHFHDLDGLDLSGVNPATVAVPLTNVMSDDIPGATLSRPEALKNAPLAKAGLFLVPMIIEE